MNCPFCDAQMLEDSTDKLFICLGGGKLLGDNPICPLKGEPMELNEIRDIEIALIDIEQTD